MRTDLFTGLNDFAESLNKRLLAKIYTTEDVVRYTFFAAVMNALDLKPENIVLEHPHPSISGARIDTWLMMPSGRMIALEFKYDRPLPSEHNAPRTQKAGQLIRDIFRLAQLNPESIDAIFVHLTTGEMARYLQNPRNGLADLHNLEPGRKLAIRGDYFAGRASTFSTAAGATIPCVVEAIVNRELVQGHALRAYSVVPLM